MEELDGTISFRIATRCEICKRGARLYELDMDLQKAYLYRMLYIAYGNYPSQQPPTNENTTQIEQP